MTLLSRVVLASCLAAPLSAALLVTSSQFHTALAQEGASPASYAQKDADRLDALIKALPKADKAKPQTVAELRQAGLKQLGESKGARAAIQSLMQAVALDPKDAPTWLALARAYLATPADETQGSERYEFPANATGAAWRAAERATNANDKASALMVMSDAMARRSLWRPAIEALKMSVATSDTPEAQAKLAKLRADHGFRILDYKVDADAAEPRLCVNFSERLAGTQGDLAKFVAVDGKDPQNLTVDNKQMCIDGLAHGKRYELQVRAGIPSDSNETLTKTAEIATYVRDRKPAIRFTGRAYVLPNRGQQGIPVVSINTDKVAVEIYRVGDRGLAGLASGENFLKQLSTYDIEQVREKSGQRVYKGELAVQSRLNEDVTTALPIGDAVPKLEPGVYILAAAIPKKTANDNDSESDQATQWFIVSDLGLTALSGSDGIHAFVRSLATADASAGITVKLVARNNEVLGTAKTDAQGYARFDAGLKRGEGGLAPALLVAEGTGDYAFLDLATAAFDLTDRGVKGRETPGAIDGYLFPERGVYRPGEPVHLTGLVRDQNGKAASLPVTLIIQRPDGVEHRRIALTDQGLGGRTVTLDLAASSMTGTWRAKLHTDPKADAIAQTAFLVEDFVPERLDLKLAPQDPSIAVEQVAKIGIDGRYLYGPPAANLDMEGEIVVRAATADLAGFPGYRFGLSDDRITSVRRPLEDLGETDADGKATIDVRLPPIPRTARPLEADVLVRLKEAGGRSIERKVTLPVAATEPRIGVKPLFTDLTVGEGEDARFEMLVLGPDNRPIDGRRIKWELSRLDQRWQWYSRDGQWNWEAITSARRIANGIAEVKDGKPAPLSTKVDWGRYRLDLTETTPDGKPTGQATSLIFNAGWHATESAESPEVLDIALDKATYKAGETARIRITSKDAGKAQIAVLSNGLLMSKQVDVPAGGVEVPLEVKETWLPGAYVTATLYRAMDEKARRMPGRAIGVKWLGLDSSAHTLKVSLDAPKKAKPDAPLGVPLRISGLTGGEEARVTVAAVDVGILNLTRFDSPAPEKWFLAQRRLGTEIRDFYGRLIDGMRAERGRLRSGGDGGTGMAMKGSPPVEKPLALFSGIVKVGDDGTANVTFDMPDFNGTVRLMAVAWSGSKVGSGTSDVIVRDQLALMATGPRFLTLGDETRLALDVHNVEGPAAGYRVQVVQEAVDGTKTSLPAHDLPLKAGEKRREEIAVKPADLGRMIYDLRVTGPGGIEVKRRVAFDVKPPAGDIRRTSVAALTPKGGRLVVSKDLLADLIPSTTRLSLSVGPTASLDVPSLLAQLDRYPYGCAEQTTSRALPLLYVNEMAKRLGIAGESEIRGRIQAAIERVFEMQDSAGAFGVWGPSSTDLWLTAYVTDFLTRAKETGYTVRQQPFNQALDRLSNFISYAQDFAKGGEARAYALYVLARNGRAPMGDLRYDVDTRLDKFASPLARAQLGAALSMLGEKERAERAFRSAITALDGEAEKTLNYSRSDYGSFVRDGAGLVTLASETGQARSSAPALATVLARAYRTRTYTSTQEQAWMVLAARALSDQSRDTKLAINGETHQGELTRTLTAADIGSNGLSVVNQGESAVDAVVSVVGSSLTPEPPVSKGFTIERSYYTLDGTKVDLASATGGNGKLAQNDRLVAVLKIVGAEAGGRVMLVDRLPAGLEIENPRLVDGGDLKGLDWIDKSVEPEHTEFRDDRFVAAFNFFERGSDQNRTKSATATVAYVVRAVTPGSFVHPAATVEDMYRPERFARSASGRLEVMPHK